MINNPIFKKFILSTIDSIIYDLKNNPQKGLKKLANLVNRFAKKSDREDLLKVLDSNSDLIIDLANNIDSETIKTFIIDLIN